MGMIHTDQSHGNQPWGRSRWPDTIPTQPGGLPACTSDRCSSGRRPCPTPDACRLPERPANVSLRLTLGRWLRGIIRESGPLSDAERTLLVLIYTTSTALVAMFGVWMAARLGWL